MYNEIILRDKPAYLWNCLPVKSVIFGAVIFL